jgi:hypothetical protein
MKWNWIEFDKATAWGCGLAVGLGIALMIGRVLQYIVELLS